MIQPSRVLKPIHRPTVLALHTDCFDVIHRHPVTAVAAQPDPWLLTIGPYAISTSAEMEESADQQSALPRGLSNPMIVNESQSGSSRRSQPFPIGAESGASDAATAQHDAQHHARRSQPNEANMDRKSRHAGRESVTESSAIDPLSQSIPVKLLGRASHEAEAGSYGVHSSKMGSLRGQPGSILNDTKNKKKTTSFLSRLIPGKKKDRMPEVAEDEAPEPDAPRMSIEKLSPLGFIPQHPGPAKYIRTRAHGKREKEFHRVFLAQELLAGGRPQYQTADRRKSSSSSNPNDESSGGAIWALSFSKDGKYLAAAGQDKKIRIWAVISAGDQREDILHGDEPTLSSDRPPRFQAPVFHPKPMRILEGHTGTILDLSWSKNNFLLSSSMDKTVRLWHSSRTECLCSFQHTDFVTSIQFHPRDDRFFLAGSLDTKLRLWNIPEKNIAFVTAVSDMITAVSFTPDGRHAIAGCLNGLLSIHDTDGLKRSGQIQVRSSRGRNARGNKITGIDTVTDPADDPHGEIKLLVTSNDSRVRLYNFQTRLLEAKFRGNENTSSQIRASFTDDGRHVICGSEDRRAYIWPVDMTQHEADKKAVEVLDTHSAIVTVAIAAPTATKQILDLTDDPVYDMCNPPPVTLKGVEEDSQPSYSQQSATTAQEPPSQDRPRSSFDPQIAINQKLAQESPSYVARSKHPDGHIIIVADYSGKIKILRQDCAYQKRRHENWSATFAISRRILRRSNSARNSVASSGGKESTHRTTSERIISWRNSVVRSGHHGNGPSRSNSRTRTSSPHGHHRPSMRSRLSSRPSSVGPHDSHSVAMASSPPSPSQPPKNPNEVQARRSNTDPSRPRKPISSRDIIANGASQDNPLWLQGDHSYAFWNTISQNAMAIKERQSKNPRGLNQTPSRGERSMSVATSVLSSENGSLTGEDDLVRCQQCGGSSFRAVKARDGSQRLICLPCNLALS
ncbi:hypothetical protein PDE_07471 [Penicillium oxalicum 114-2]|uniref:Uncharacterized protein n=1 Tax=Penicillium oxalicum (strain 114-2 / CGMCC 5302) TaxID=933388 RepID=S7ZUT0_PENO1|nr:hypothetical protein PDE_07471 [Penicillium oxalicum 114-2]